MYKSGILLLAIVYATLAAEIPAPNMLEKLSTFKPVDISMETQHVFKKDIQYEKEHHPVYRGEDYKNEGRARIEPVRSQGPVVKHDMLADDSAVGSTDVNRVDNLPLPEYGYGHPPSEVAYPDIPYAPGYGYGNGYDVYGNSLSDYLLEPDTSTFGLLWSQVPDSRIIVHLMGRTIGWILNSVFVLLIGSLITVGVCSYTNLCTITFQGVGPIHEEMRSFITPERLEKISTAANFVKTAIDKYQKIQKVTDQGIRKRSVL
ncbi:PREDICTED: uncharacterized protein LOC106122584 [Papilio xuthus]|uniref:Uncharacterized protein LOC106122584 n=1 Tax=Papilio xuthus TaxID=66420 RepID=A0AAJ6ZK08_PAPXU|nr:PREDICTED: uncharacterized protein LOC106122584 [Papilio xuthus]